MSGTQHMANAGAAMDSYGGKTATGDSLQFRDLVAQIVGK